MGMEHQNIEIIPAKSLGMTYKQGTLHATYERIVEVLGEPNYDDDVDKVSCSWAFHVNGKPLAIWDWKGSRYSNQFSYYGDPETIAMLFDKETIS